MFTTQRQPLMSQQNTEQSGPRLIWWGWRRCWRRPVWFTRGVLGAPDARELGVGPVSVLWTRGRRS